MSDKDPYAERVRQFHKALKEADAGEYHAVTAEQVRRSDEYDFLFEDTNAYQRKWMAEVIAERNRLFWATFINEEAGEIAGALISGEPPEDFEEEVADNVIVAHGIADAFDFDMFEAFSAKMDENDQKPKNIDESGKLQHEDWRDDRP